MKAGIHPKYHLQAQVTCVCGSNFTVGSSKDKLIVEVCYKCHPLFTGEERFVDVKGQVEKFKQKVAFAKEYLKKPRVQEKLKTRTTRKSLKDLLSEA